MKIKEYILKEKSLLKLLMLIKKRYQLSEKQNTIYHKHTLYEPKSCTTHVKNASRPTEAVTFAMGKVNLGSAERKE